MNREFAGLFRSETELQTKMNELATNGIAEKNMYVVTKDKDDVAIVRGKTDAEIQSVDTSWWERFTHFLSDEQPAKKAIHQMNLSQEEITHYMSAVENGALLLYVDKGDFWDTSDHDKGDLTSPVVEKMDMGGSILPENNDIVQQERHLDERTAQQQTFRNKL